MTARDQLFSVACSDMPVTSGEVNEAINRYKQELLGVDPACSGLEYLRKRFDEAIWESPLGVHFDPDAWGSAVDALVTRLLIEAGVE